MPRKARVVIPSGPHPITQWGNKHMDRRLKERIRFRYETLFPALAGRLLYNLGYMDTILSYEEAKEHFRVDEVIRGRYKE